MPLLLSIVIFFFPLGVSASVLTLEEGGDAEVRVMLDPEGASINAVEGNIKLPSAVSIRSIETGHSIASLWVEYPTSTERGIRFAAVFPGGFIGSIQDGKPGYQKGELFRFSLSASSGEYPLSFGGDASVYLNDGLGTFGRLATRGTFITLSRDAQAPPAVVDILPPEEFSIVLEDAALFEEEGQALVFTTTDKGSSVSYRARYVRSMFDFLRTPLWEEVESPIIIRPGEGVPTVYIRAVDAHGNERVAAFHSSAILLQAIFGILGVTIVAVLFRVLLLRFRHRLHA